MTAHVFEPADPDFATRVCDSFARQAMMAHLGAEMALVEPGRVEIAMPFHESLTQQHGFVHAGALASIADSAGGYAATSLFPATAQPLTVEFKLNLLAPAAGERFLAVGQVLRPGRTLTVCELQVHAERAGESKLCATGLQTMMRIEGRADVAEVGAG